MGQVLSDRVGKEQSVKEDLVICINIVDCGYNFMEFSCEKSVNF